MSMQETTRLITIISKYMSRRTCPRDVDKMMRVINNGLRADARDIMMWIDRIPQASNPTRQRHMREHVDVMISKMEKIVSLIPEKHNSKAKDIMNSVHQTVTRM